MRNKNQKRIEAKYIILIVIGIIILLLSIYSYTIKDKRNLSGIEKILKDTVIVVENIILFPFRYVTNEIQEFIKLKDVYKENEILKRNLDRYDTIYTQNKALKKQIDELKEIANINYVLTDYEYLNATVINRNVGYWFDNITISKGSKDGIKKDMAVITSKGLIGKVIKTTALTSDVKLITSNNSNNRISVIIDNNGSYSYGILSRYDEKENKLLIEGISDNNDIQKDSIVYTSGLNDAFPNGINVGRVTKIEKDSYGLSKILYVEPVNDMNNLTLVSVLKRKDGK